MAKLFVTLVALFIAANSAPARAEGNLFYILDGSGSMWAEFEGRTRIEVARDLLSDRLPKWQAENTNIGLIAYGHNRKGDCTDIEVLVELGPAQPEALEQAIRSISPKGKTPIAASIDLVAQRLRTSEDSAHVILVSDGLETCHPDPCGSVRRLRALGIAFTMDVVGFDVTEEERAQLQCLAKEAGGTYFSAASAPEAIQALEEGEKNVADAMQLVPIAPPEEIVKVAQNVQFIVDTSASMADPFDGTTKIAAIQSRLDEKLADPVSDQENLSLRVFGGSCGSTIATRLIVPFDVGNGASIRAALDATRLEGEPTLGASLRGAIDDFDDTARYEGVSRRVVLFAGSAGACDPMLPWQIKEHFERAKITPVLHLIAMDPSPNQIRDIENMAGALRGYLHVVRSEEDLDRVLTSILEVDPVRDGVAAITKMLNGVVGHMNASSHATRRDDFATASAEIAAAQNLLRGSGVQFADLGSRASRETFRKLYDLADANRGLQKEGLAIAGGLVEAKKANDVTRWNNLIGSWNTSINEYNYNIREIDKLLKGL